MQDTSPAPRRERPVAEAGPAPFAADPPAGDTAQHVNNAVDWAALEDVIAGLGWRPSIAELEYHRTIRPGAHPRLLTRPGTGPEVYAWLLDGMDRLASGRLAR